METVEKIKMSVSSNYDMRESLKWMLLARTAILFLILFTVLTKDIFVKSPMSEVTFQHSLLLLSCSFLMTFLQGAILEKIIVHWGWIVGQIIFDAVVTSLWIYWGQESENVFPIFYLVQILVVSLSFYQRGAWISSLIAVLFLGGITFSKYGFFSSSWFMWAVYSAIFVILGMVGGVLSEELRRTTENLKKKTAEVEKLTEFQERIIAEIPTGFLIVDQDMKINFINPAAEHILGVLARDSVGKPLATVSKELMPFFTQIESEEIVDSDEEVVGERETSVSATGSEFHRSVFLKAKSETGGQARLQQTVEVGSGLQKRTLRGDVAEIDVEAGIGRLLQGQAKSGRVLLFQDVTEIVHLEDKLKQNEKLAAVGQLAAGIAHEIRNPLASMSASIEMLKTAQEWTDPENKKLMEITLKEIDRLNGLISEFLDFVKPEKIKLKPLSLDDLLSEVVAVASGMREIKEIATISTRFEKVSVLAHEEKLKQVVWNLLLNSVQALSQPGKIEIGCEALNAQRVKWWISDTGQGMTEEVLAHIYEPFFTTKPKGTGLGLPTVYKIIEAHHGEIKVNSTYGKGTCFEIYIPRS